MQYGIVLGTVVATQKTPSLIGRSFKVIQACDSQRQKIGDPLVALDSVGARLGDLVIWVGKREASLAVPGAELSNDFPLDAAITGIVDAVG